MTAPDDGVSILEPVGGRPLASGLTADPECDVTEPGRTAAVLEWVPAPAGGEQRVEVTAFFRGFETGDFVATPTLPEGRSHYRLLDPEPGARYEWRVLTHGEDGWTPSEPAAFHGAPCIIDSQ
jgi:hypothetical protein